MRVRKSNKAALVITLASCIAATSTIAPAQTPQFIYDAGQTALWDILKDSDNPEAFRSYLELYPDGPFADEARRLQEAVKSDLADEGVTLEVEDRSKPANAPIPELPRYQPQGFLGANVREPGKDTKILVDQFEKKGALISGLTKHGPAAGAGLKIGDVIIGANNQIINDPEDLAEISSRMEPGDTITIEFFRDRRRNTVSFPIGDRFALLWREAHLGKPSSMYSLFFAFRDGNGPRKDIDTALDWLHRASDAGHARAHYTLARRYQLGRGVGKDLSRALHLFEKAGNAGDGRGMYRAGWMHRWGEGTEKNPASGAVWYRRAINAGEPRALTGLAALYRLGEGAPKDYKKARMLYGEAVARNQRSAYLALARMHLRGEGGPEDADRAVGLLTTAVKLGHTRSMVVLGELYLDGEQIKRDRARGVKLLRQAAAKGDRTALRKLDERNITAYDPLELQQLLARAGFDPGPLDGKPGRKTRTAIRAFQQDAALKVDGDPSLEVVLALRKRLEAKTDAD